MSQNFTQTQITKGDDCQDPIFKSKEEMRQYLSRLCYGNLHIIGRIWIESVKSALVGTKMCLVPTVQAAAKPKLIDDTPKKPPKMKYKDLPLYENPHSRYKDYLVDEDEKCLGDNPKLLQCAALPIVSKWRRTTQSALTDVTGFIKESARDLKNTVVKQKSCFINCIRNEELYKRRATVILGTAAAYIIAARRTPLYYPRLFWSSVAAVTTGWLCFPKETDIVVREVGWNAHQLLKKLYDFWYNEVQPLPVIAPCPKDLPPIPQKCKENPKHACPKKCK
ncbi:hypothetical protein NE865_04260 [Phthorimaea operculella]|nr:hypothetical protein NE865_04260 [Phthorimaea operculella]